MINTIKTVAILGSGGTVGSLTGGLIAQHGINVYMLSRTQASAEKGLKRAIKQARSEVIQNKITCGDYDGMLQEALGKADLVIESVTEDLPIKQHIYEMVDKYRRDDTIIGTTTSSLPLNSLPIGRSQSFRRHFMSTHFYNPPGKMTACEIASTPDTDKEVYEFIKTFLEKKLRRAIIPTNPIAGFAGNRIAFLLFNRITSLAVEYGVEMMDYLIGPYTGRLMAPLATLDLVGLDIHKAIVESLYKNTHDQMHHSLVLPDYINKMLTNGMLGNKTPEAGGFYKKLISGKFVYIDPETCEYIPAIYPHVVFVEKAKHQIHMGLYKEAFETILTAHSREAEIVKDILCVYVSYAYGLIGEVTEKTDGIEGIDKVMSYGFNWAAPSLVVKMMGGKDKMAELIDKKGFQVPDGLKEASMERKIASSGRYFPAR